MQEVSFFSMSGKAHYPPLQKLDFIRFHSLKLNRFHHNEIVVFRYDSKTEQ